MQKIFKKKCLFLISTVLCATYQAYPMNNYTSASLIQSAYTYDVMRAEKILSQKNKFGLSWALHSNYELNRANIVFLLLKSGFIGSNNKDQNGNTLLQKAIIDNKKNFLRKLFNLSGTPSLNVNQKNKHGNAAIHISLDIIDQKAPDITVIKLLTRHPNLNFDLKNRQQQTPLVLAQLNLMYFKSNRPYQISKFEKKKNIITAEATINHLKLAMEYQNTSLSKDNKDYEKFLNDKTPFQMNDIVHIALYQNNHVMLKTINRIHSELFSWLNMLSEAELHDFIKPIGLIMGQLEITSQECHHILDRTFNKKGNTSSCSKKRKKMLGLIKKIYREATYASDFQNAMLDYLTTLPVLYRIFKENIDIARNCIEYTY